MRKFCIYIILMIIIVIFIPLIIVHKFSAVQQPEVKEQKSELSINVYMADQKKIVKMPLEEYLIGVVAAEMPASYEIEALKAQAIAARTYAMGRAAKLYGSPETAHDGADVCTSPAHCQAWISKETAMKRWGLIPSFRYWNKICKAVNDTAGQIIEYDNVIINPLFHSNSGGHTENSEDVWDGTAEPYLRGVESPGEDFSSEFRNEVILKQDQIIKTLKEFNPKFNFKGKDLLQDIEIEKYSSGDRVMVMKIANITLKGTDFRKLFQLKSTNFKFSKSEDGEIAVTTLGYGHGVGMSQCGANYLALNGVKSTDILKFYYKGVEIAKIS